MTFRTIMLVLPTCLFLLLVACSSEPANNEPVTLTIAGVHQVLFKGEYGDQLEIEGKQITLNVVPYEDLPRSPDGFNIDVERLINEFSPDIMYWGGVSNLRPLIEKGLLQPMDNFIQAEGDEFDDFAPFLLEQIRETGDGQIYAWPASFNTEVLFYNKTLFDRYRVPYPPEVPSWSDIFQRMEELFHMTRTEAEPVYPLMTPGSGEPTEKLFWLLHYAGKTEGLQFIDPMTWTATANSASWHSLWSLFIDAFEQGLLSNEAYEEHAELAGLTDDERYKIFLEGRAAMVTANPSLFYMLTNQDKFEWEIVSQPGMEQIYLQVPELYMINAASPRQEEAWALISYLNNKENITRKIAVSTQQSGGIGSYFGSFPARIGVMEQALDVDLSPFYAQPLAAKSIYEENAIPTDLYTYMKEQVIVQIEAVLSNDKTVDEALEALQASLEVGVDNWLDEEMVE